MTSVGLLIRLSLTTSLLWRKIRLLALTEFHMVPTGVPGVWVRSSSLRLTSICWKEVPFLILLLKVGLSLSSRPLTSMTMEEFFDLQTRFVLWRYAIVIAHFSLLLSVEASIGTPRDTYILRRDVSLPGRRTTSLRLRPPLWLMLRALRKNQASYWRTLLPPIPASITPGSSPWLRKQNCLSLSAASYEVFENDSITPGTSTTLSVFRILQKSNRPSPCRPYFLGTFQCVEAVRRRTLSNGSK